MNPWAVLAIAIAAVIVALWIATAIDVLLHARRREHGLRRIYEQAQAEVDERAGVDRLRDRRPW